MAHMFLNLIQADPGFASLRRRDLSTPSQTSQEHLGPANMVCVVWITLASLDLAQVPGLD